VDKDTLDGLARLSLGVAAASAQTTNLVPGADIRAVMLTIAVLDCLAGAYTRALFGST
jgi:hypothetical protein